MRIEDYKKDHEHPPGTQGLAPNTLIAYVNSLDLFSRFNHGEEPTQPSVVSWLNTFESAATLNRHKAAMLSYWSWLYPETNAYGLPEKPLVFGAHTFAGKKQSTWREVDPKVMEDIIAHVIDYDDRFCLETLNTIGCRIHELIGDPDKGFPGLYFADIKTTGVRMIVKGQKERTVPVPPDFLARLRVYGMGKEGRIFPQSYSHLRNLVNRVAKELGYSEVRLHDYRHSYTTNLLDSGVEDRIVAQARGDSNTNQLMRYSHRTEQALQDKISKKKESDK
jgi:integrase